MNKYNVFRISKEDEITFLKNNYNHIPKLSTHGTFYDMGCGNGELILHMIIVISLKNV